MKVSRHAKIIELISQYDIETQEELAEQKSSADELENVCKSILQSAGEAG